MQFCVYFILLQSYFVLFYLTSATGLTVLQWLFAATVEFICDVQLACMIYVRQKVNPMNPYASNWLERLRRIRQMHERLSAERAKATSTSVHSLTSRPGGDFADFVK